MNLETVNITFQDFDLRTIRNFIKSGIRHEVSELHKEGGSLDAYLDESNDEIEMLSSLCSLYSQINFHEFAKNEYGKLERKLDRKDKQT